MNWLKDQLYLRVWVSRGSSLLAIVIIVLEILNERLATLPAQYARPVGGILAVILLGMRNEQAKKMAAEAAAAAKLAVPLLLLAFGSARADSPLVHCFSGCKGPTVPRSSMASSVMPDVQLSDVLWVGPGIGAPPLIYNGGTKTWTVSASPVLSYGLWWRPASWTATKSLFGVNLALSGEIVGVPQAHLDPVLTVNILDNIQVGGGIRANFAAPGQKGSLDPLFAVYWSTSFGGP